MPRRQVEEVAFADVRKANNGPYMPETIKAQDVYAVDPGTQRAGLAWFHAGKLVAATVLVPRGEVAERVQRLRPLAEAWLSECHAQKAVGWKSPALAMKDAHIRVEFPEVQGSWTKNPRSVLWVAAAAGSILGAFPPVAKVIDENPKQWKGNLSKEGGNDIVLEALYPDELEVLRRQGKRWDDNNMLDAVGIGLQYLLRMRGA